MKPEPLLIVLSGTSGAGKDSVLNKMKEQGFPFYYTITLTTRPQREGETDGVDYYFTSDANFLEMVKREALLEYAKVYGHWYGVPKLQVMEALDKGQDVIIKVDVQGALSIKRLIPDAVLIFLAPTSVEEQEERLRQRKTESETDLKLRLKTFQDEMRSLPIFDYLVVNSNGKLDSSVSQIHAIVVAEKCRTFPRKIEF